VGGEADHLLPGQQTQLPLIRVTPQPPCQTLFLNIHQFSNVSVDAEDQDSIERILAKRMSMEETFTDRVELQENIGRYRHRQ
jgi:hypothetical protein